MFSTVKGSSGGFCSKEKICFLNLLEHCLIDRKSDWVLALGSSDACSNDIGPSFQTIFFFVALAKIVNCC